MFAFKIGELYYSHDFKIITWPFAMLVDFDWLLQIYDINFYFDITENLKYTFMTISKPRGKKKPNHDAWM